MESSNRLVQTWMASGRDDEINEIVSEISSNKNNLISVVKALGEYLTSEESDQLQRGVELLSLVVDRVPNEKLNQQSVRVLTAFFVGKLEDSVTVKPALSGLLSFAGLPIFSSAEVTAVVDGLFRHVRMKGLVQDVRFKVFSIIDTLIASHREVLKSMGRTFLDGYISLAEGEKDPRNLMVAFAIARVILIEFDISNHTESIFNILFCYFPITFRPPPNDKYGISTDDLRIGLRKCLSATPTFGSLAIPVFLEKLTAGSRATKRDTLETLASCIPVYGSALGRAYARKLWNSLKLEIFQPVDPQTEEDALKTVQVLVKTIYTDEEAAVESNDDVHGLARDACEECINILKEPEKSQARAATKILCAFMSTTPSVSRYTISQAVPHLVQLFHNPDEASNREPTLALLSELIESARHADQKNHTVNPPLTPYKDDVLGVLTVGLQSPSLRAPSLAGLKALSSTDALLTDEELGFIVHKVDDIIEGNQDEFDEASEAILDLLTTISDRAPRHVAEQTLPLLFASLPDVAPSREAVAEREKCWRTLSSLRSLCLHQELFEKLIVRLTTKLDLLCFPSHEPHGDLETSQAYVHMILKTLAQVLATKTRADHPDVAKYIDRLVPSIFNIFIASAFFSEDRSLVATDQRLISVAGEIVTLVVQSLPVLRQQQYAAGLSKAIIDGDITDIAQGFQKIPSSHRLSIFGDASKAAHRNILVLLSAAVVSMHKEIQLSIGSTGFFLDKLLNWVIETANTDFQRLSALHMVASIVNRRVDELASFLDDKLKVYWATQISNSSLPVDKRKWAIKSWTWISKALLVRKHPLAMSFVVKLYDAFGDGELNWEAAEAFGNIASPDLVLTKANHAEVKILYVQKYVSTVLPRLIVSSKDASNTTEQIASLVALTSTIKSIPRAAYVHEMPVLIPLLLRGLDLPDATIRSNVINTFLSAAQGESTEKNLVSEHSTTLVNAMLRNASVEEMPSVKVRISALRYLGIMPDIVRYDVLHPHKATVLRELAKVLDDPKKDVRKAAVDARTNWFKYKG